MTLNHKTDCLNPVGFRTLNPKPYVLAASGFLQPDLVLVWAFDHRTECEEKAALADVRWDTLDGTGLLEAILSGRAFYISNKTRTTQL